MLDDNKPMITKELEEELRRSSKFNEDAVKNNAALKFCDVLCGFLKERNISKADFIRMINIDRNYGYLILNGSRVPTRNFVIQSSFILGLNVDELNSLLTSAGKNQLYVRNYLDARVYYAIMHNMDYYDAYDFIWGESETVT